jgi:hypothetical protein
MSEEYSDDFLVIFVPVIDELGRVVFDRYCRRAATCAPRSKVHTLRCCLAQSTWNIFCVKVNIGPMFEKNFDDIQMPTVCSQG